MDDSMIFSVYLDQLDDGSGKDDKKGGKKEKVETAQETTPDDPKKTKSKKGVSEPCKSSNAFDVNFS